MQKELSVNISDTIIAPLYNTPKYYKANWLLLKTLISKAANLYCLMEKYYLTPSK